MGDSKVTVDDRVWRELRVKIRGIAQAHARVGVVGDAADVEDEDGVSMGLLAMWMELGTRFIPARSFVRAAMDAKLDELRAIQARIAKMLILEKVTLRQAMGILGAWGAGAIRSFVTQGKVTPPLQPETIARKGSSKPLVDTGQLVNSIGWVTSEDGQE